MSCEATSVWSWGCMTSNRAFETFQIILTALVPLFIMFCLIFFLKKHKNAYPPLPPGPRGLPLVGYLPFLGQKLHHSFKELASLYGPIFIIRLGTKDCVVVSSPSLVKEVLKDHDAVFANRVPNIAAKNFVSGSLDITFSSYCFEWRKMRKIFVSEMMSKASLDASYHFRKKQINKILNETYNKAGQLVDIGELAFLTLVTTLMNLMWADTLKTNESSIVNAEFRAVLNKQIC